MTSCSNCFPPKRGREDGDIRAVGDEMRVTLDGEPAACLKSSGIAHPTKSKIELGVAGKDGFFDDIKVWNAETVKR